MKLRFFSFAALALFVLPACGSTSGDEDGGEQNTGGSGGFATGGASTGGASTGGVSTGGVSTGGASGGQPGQHPFCAQILGSSVGVGGAGVGGTDAGTGGSDTGGIPATFDTIKEIIGSNLGCVSSDCHGGDLHTPMTMQVNDQLYARLTTHVSEGCCNLRVVEPGQPNKSALVHVLKGDCADISRMPYGCIEDEFSTNCLPPEYIDAVERWISAGAPQ